MNLKPKDTIYFFLYKPRVEKLGVDFKFYGYVVEGDQGKNKSLGSTMCTSLDGLTHELIGRKKLEVLPNISNGLSQEKAKSLGVGYWEKDKILPYEDSDLKKVKELISKT
ncbi:hypothetical protein KY348_04740 [Candidatus Woesearchaeota archaeon]|nr:hypothetical protein [Candidatus Woesearchaeota archaeon]